MPKNCYYFLCLGWKFICIDKFLSLSNKATYNIFQLKETIIYNVSLISRRIVFSGSYFNNIIYALMKYCICNICQVLTCHQRFPFILISKSLFHLWIRLWGKNLHLFNHSFVTASQLDFLISNFSIFFKGEWTSYFCHIVN